MENDINILTISEDLIKENIESLSEIEYQYFNNIGVWNVDNFLYELNNKFECSFFLFSWSKLIWYIIWQSKKTFWYINRVAVSDKYKWSWLWKYLMDYFLDNLKYNFWVNKVELVTHKSLNIGWFYAKIWYINVNKEKNILDFLKRTKKEDYKDEYIGNEKKMLIYYKNI